MESMNTDLKLGFEQRHDVNGLTPSTQPRRSPYKLERFLCGF